MDTSFLHTMLIMFMCRWYYCMLPPKLPSLRPILPQTLPWHQHYFSTTTTGATPWSSSSVLDHRSLPLVFESRRGHSWRLFHLWFRLTTFGGCLAHLAYHVHNSGRKTSIIIIIIYHHHHNNHQLNYHYSVYYLMCYTRITTASVLNEFW